MLILRGAKVLCFDTLLQVLILKEVKVVCFDTLLQVLILKGLRLGSIYASLPVAGALKERQGFLLGAGHKLSVPAELEG